MALFAYVMHISGILSLGQTKPLEVKKNRLGNYWQLPVIFLTSNYLVTFGTSYRAGVVDRPQEDGAPAGAAAHPGQRGEPAEQEAAPVTAGARAGAKGKGSGKGKG